MRAADDQPMAVHLRLEKAKRNAYRKFSGARSWNPIYNYTIDAQKKRDMRRRHPDVDFDWQTITRQLAEKREICRRYHSRRRTVRAPRVREPFYGVFDPAERTVYVNDPTNIAGMSAMLDAIIAGRP